MSFQVNEQDNYVIVSFNIEKLDATVSPDLKSELVIINKKGVKNILIDLASVKYCDSSGLSALLIGNRLCNELGGSFIVSSAQPAVQKLIKISQLDSILNITPTLPEAIDMLFMEELERGLEEEEDED